MNNPSRLHNSFKCSIFFYRTFMFSPTICQSLSTCQKCGLCVGKSINFLYPFFFFFIVNHIQGRDSRRRARECVHRLHRPLSRGSGQAELAGLRGATAGRHGQLHTDHHGHGMPVQQKQPCEYIEYEFLLVACCFGACACMCVCNTCRFNRGHLHFSI